MQISDKNRDKRSIALLALLCALLQLALATNLGFGNGRANIAIVFAVTVASHRGLARPRRRGQEPHVGRLRLVRASVRGG